MRISLIVSALLALTGCSVAPTEDDISAMLQANDPKVCASSEVKRTALTAIDEEYRLYIENGGEDLEVKSISSTGIDTDIHEIKCSANISFKDTKLPMMDASARDFTFTYAVRPSLSDDAEYIVSVQADDLLQMYLWGTINNFNSMQAGEMEAMPEVAPAATHAQPAKQPVVSATDERGSAASSIWTDGVSVSGNCTATVAGRKVMSGACSGRGHGSSVFVTAEYDGCSIELTRTDGQVTGSLFAYKNTCGSPESAPNNRNIDLGSFTLDGDCWRTKSTSVCLRPSAL